MQRNYSIDTLKFICAVLVVMLHTESVYQDLILPITRCAVPVFFMISGYLLYNGKEIGKERLKRNIVTIAKIMLWSTLLFAVLKEFMALYHGYLFLPNAKEWIDFIVLNENPFGFHLWYLGAYLYVLLIVGFVDKYDKWNYLFMLIPILLAGDLIFGKYSLLLLNKEYPYIYVRNFLFVGLPYFALGALLKTKAVKISSVNKYLLSGGVILFSLTSMIEKYILLYIGKSPIREHYISTTFLAVCLFLLVLSSQQKRSSIISRLGEKDSLYIYIFHPLFLIYFFPQINKIIPADWVANVYSFCAPLLVLIVTVFFTMILRKMKIIR